MKKHFITLNRQACVRVLFFSLILLFAAHAFCFFNLTYSSPSVMFNAANGYRAQMSGGVYLQPYYWRLRGELAAPLLIGLLCAAYMTLNAMLTADLLHCSHPLTLFLLCGSLIANGAVTSELAAHLHTADALFLSQLMGTAGVFLCMRMRSGFIPGAALFAGSLGMHSGGFSCAAALMLIVSISDVLRGEAGKPAMLRAGKTLLGLAAGAALYAAGYLVLVLLRGFDAEAMLQLPSGGSLLSAWLAPVRTLFAPLTAYVHMNVLLRAVIACLCVCAVFLAASRLGARRFAALLIPALLLPFMVNLPVFSSASAGQYPLSFVYLDVFAIMLLGAAWHMLPACQPVRCAATACFSVLFLSATVFSNQVYLKKNLEMQSTLSVMTRVIDRIEQTEGYRPGYTPVALVGTLEDSALSIPHQGFEHLTALEAASGNYVIASYEDAIWYAYQIIGYPLNFVSTYDQERLSAREDIMAMPAFPFDGCIRYVGDTLVVKLSD